MPHGQSGGCKGGQNEFRTKGDAGELRPYLQTRVVDIGDNFKLVLELADAGTLTAAKGQRAPPSGGCAEGLEGPS